MALRHFVNVLQNENKDELSMGVVNLVSDVLTNQKPETISLQLYYIKYRRRVKRGVRRKRRKEKGEEGGRGGSFQRREKRKGRKDERKGER